MLKRNRICILNSQKITQKSQNLYCKITLVSLNLFVFHSKLKDVLSNFFNEVIFCSVPVSKSNEKKNLRKNYFNLIQCEKLRHFVLSHLAFCDLNTKFDALLYSSHKNNSLHLHSIFNSPLLAIT